MPSDRILRLALRANATVSTITGILFVIPTRIAPALTGLPSSELISLGASLLGFAALLWWISFRNFEESWVQFVIAGIVAADLFWVIDTVLQLIHSPLYTGMGRWIFGGLAVIVAMLAEAQAYGLWRVYRNPVSSTSAAAPPRTSA